MMRTCQMDTRANLKELLLIKSVTICALKWIITVIYYSPLNKIRTHGPILIINKYINK